MLAPCPFYPSVADVQMDITVVSSKSSSCSRPVFDSAQWHGFWCQTSAKRTMAECAACFIVSHIARGSESAIMKFTFIFPTCRFQVLLLPNWQNEQDSHSGDCSTTRGRSLRTICHLWVMPFAQACASRKMTQLADSGEQTSEVWINQQTMQKKSHRSLHLLKQGDGTEQKLRSQQETLAN